MATLQGRNINDTYKGLIKTFSNGQLTSSNLITDGSGNFTALTLGSAGNSSSFDNSLVVNTTILACNNLTTNSNLCVKGSGTFDNNIIVTGNTLITGNLTASSFNFNGAGTFNGGITFNNTIGVCGVTNLKATNIVGDLNVTGAINATNDITAFSTSDSRLKENLIPIDSESFVSNLTGYEFNWNSKSKRTGKGKGIIAQDLYNIDTSLVKENSDGYLTVDYTSLIPVLIEEVKRLGKEIEALKNLQHH
tara:strand:- start:9216 stop:9962 length:747 start_codon:yes stop_codon:yes gene_type:complete